MTDMSENKSAATLEREAADQRQRVESTIDALRERLSPGQLVDEVLSYTKDGGGAFAGNLMRNVSANPIPATLLGISLAWLMAKPAPSARDAADRDWDRRFSRRDEDYDSGAHESYPAARVTGKAMRRVSQATDEAGRRYSEFMDDAGKTFRAFTDEMGNRAGHFADETGALFSGFTDEAGNRIAQFRDEAGAMLDEAGGWAAESWQAAGQRFNEARDQVQHKAEQVGQTLTHLLENQPLVGGALAFAVGAALGAALPHTKQEDELLGEAADKVRHEAGKLAGSAYEKGKEAASELYEDAGDAIAHVYDDAKSRMGNQEQQQPYGSGSRH